VAQFQVNAIMPSNAPLGSVQVTVTYNNATSAPAPAQIVVNNFGSFAVAGGVGPGIVQNFVSATQVPLNTITTSANIGQAAILWGTGLGPLPAGQADNVLPTIDPNHPILAGVTIQVMVGGVSVQPFYAARSPQFAGVDQVNFIIPANAPLGCYVPVQIIVNGGASNTITMAIANSGQTCSDSNPLSTNTVNGGNNATISLARINYTSATDSTGISSGEIELGAALFEQTPAGGSLSFNVTTSLPPVGTCTQNSSLGFLSGLMGIASGVVPSIPGDNSTPLDAGSVITVKGPNGAKAMTYSSTSSDTSPYVGIFGSSGAIAALGVAPASLYLDPGSYSISGAGGAGVGPFQANMNISPGVTWTNRDQISTITKSQGLNINWSGGNPATQQLVILGFASVAGQNASSGFLCLSALDSGSFTVPPGMMYNLPSTSGALIVLTVPSNAQMTTFQTTAAPSLNNAVARYAVGEYHDNVTFK
jgi:uncharacterized protein (TIGR03437 family)